jgi:hypothetical protein
MLSLVKKGKRADILQFALVMLADLSNGSTQFECPDDLEVNGFSEELMSLDVFEPLLKCL